jgi:hypothetical protein
MKRKTYEKKMRNFLHQLNQMQPAEKRLPDTRPNRPEFWFIPEVGKYAGEPIMSYQREWDVLVDIFKGSPLAEKL